MKLRRIIAGLLTVALLVSSFSFAISAAEIDTASTSYYNESYLETYAQAAYNESGLGVSYTETATTWKVWSPPATEVKVKLYNTGTDTESGAGVVGAYAMQKNETTGVWTLTMNGDFKNKYYTYQLTIDGGINETQDPYGTACGANGDRSMVADLDATDPEGWNSDKHVFFDNQNEASVWEVHVRDFSISESSGVSEENRGKFLAFSEGGTTVNSSGDVATCVDYLVEKGVNCVQLMPIADFASIDETDASDKRNWGYDPKNYNVPEGSYSSDPYNGNTRITEYKELVQALHDRGIAVVMDVVYNHTFVLEGSCLSQTVPKYYYRMSSSTAYCDGSGLGNTLSTDKLMTRKFVIDSLKYWADEYHIDGFRFDLMGCIDYPTMNAIRTELDKVSTKLLTYGEPWVGGPNSGISNGATNSNISKLNSRVGAFNESYSVGLKGENGFTSRTKGFIEGGAGDAVYAAASGTSSSLSGAAVTQLVNYTDNHDNLCLFDKILYVNGLSGFTTAQAKDDLYDKNKNYVNTTNQTYLSQVRLALTSCLTSQGIPFTQAGAEFCRTKYGDANSYDTIDLINGLDWTRAKTYKTEADYYGGLVKIREAYSGFTNPTKSALSSVSAGSGCIAYQVSNNKSGEWNKVIVALNGTSSAKSVTLSGSWVVVADGTRSGTTKIADASGSYSVPAYSGVVLVDSSSFANYQQPATGTATLKAEHYVRDSASGSYTLDRSSVAKYTPGLTYRAVADSEILFDHNLDKWESTSNATSGTTTAGQSVTVKFYYTRFVNSNYMTVNFYDTTSNQPIRSSMKYRFHEGDEFSIPANPVQGFELDATKYPGGTYGKFDASATKTFNFYYSALTNDTTIVHYYKSNSWGDVLCYAYTDQGIEPLGDWNAGKSALGMKRDTALGAGWYSITIPSASCYVMFHPSQGGGQEPGQGESGYAVSGEAWIQNRTITFNCKVVTSHVDLATGKQLSPDAVKEYNQVNSKSIYATSPVTTLGGYIAPANASDFYTSGVTNVVYLYDGSSAPEGSLTIGDVDLDGDVSIIDATTLQRVLAGLITQNEDSKTASKCDGDEDISIIDATYIQRYLASVPLSDSRVGKKVGGGQVETGEHTFEELVTVYNELAEEFKLLSPTTYASNENYIKVKNILNNNREITMNASSSADDIDAAYAACQEGLEVIKTIGGENPPVGDEVTLYFTNNKSWPSVNAYTWLTGGEGGTWPGAEMSSVGTNDYGESIYSITINTTTADNVIFNGGDAGQTIDIAVTSGMQNGIYCLDTQDDQGHYEVGYYDYGGSSPVDPPVGPTEPISFEGQMALAPNSDWMGSGARFAAYFFEGSNSTWVNMKFVSVGLYSVDIPTGFSNVIFVRLDGSKAENSWTNKWNQTEDLTVTPGGTYTITGWDTGTW